MKKQIKNVINIYTFGNGKISCGTGTEENSEMIFISVGKLSESEKIGTDLNKNPKEESQTVILRFKNIEGFKSFKKVMKKAELELKKQQKFLK